MADHDRDYDQNRGMERRGGTGLERYGGQVQYYGSPEWHQGTDAYGNPVWYRAYGWSWTSGQPQGGQQQGQPHQHGRTQARGYQRSDDRIREDVCDRLNDHPGIDSSDIHVTVQNGEVTLEGTVDHRGEKRMAEDIADSVSGVKDVQNRLRVSQQGQGQSQHQQGQQGGQVNRASFHDGMEVVGSNGDKVGTIKQVRDQDFLVDRSGQTDVFIPFHAVDNVARDRVTLNVPAGRVDDMGWASPETTAAQAGGSKKR